MSSGDAEDDIGSPEGSESSDRSTPPWWREKRKSSRPWVDKPRRKKTVPPEQAEGYARARRSVARAARSVLGTAVGLAHEALILSAEPLSLVPVPGLSEAARSLLTLWDALEQVETNRMACVSLVERCGDILFAVRTEITLAGDKVEDTLKEPVDKLTQAFKQSQDALTRQWDKPFLKRYIQREADLRRIGGCNQALTDAVSLFSLSIQIRTLKFLQESEAQRLHDLTNFRPNVLPPVSEQPPAYPPSPLGIGTTLKGDSSSTIIEPLPTRVVAPLPPDPTCEQIFHIIQRLQEKHASLDAHLDAEDLRSILRAALHEPDDAGLIRMLQVERSEWPEAIRTLQRQLERMQAPVVAAEVDKKEDSVHREFVEAGIECLRRMSGEGDFSVPSWTITKYEVDTERIIGIGTFSSVYSGTWKGRHIAIKLLHETTPRELFLHEMQIWQRLKHPHILQVFGGSSATSDPPWFFVSPYMKNGTLVRYLKANRDSNGGLRAPLNPISMMQQIAIGMRYLHSEEVLHGDLKAVNVLIDDDLKCVISDFGQSRLKNEVYRLSGRKERSKKQGTVRWLAPEALTSSESALTMEMDVYAFAITCVEILTRGELPWANLDDVTVTNVVIINNSRPQIPLSQYATQALIHIIRLCWDSNKKIRPSFEEIVKQLEFLITPGANTPIEGDITPHRRPVPLPEIGYQPSPPLRPIVHLPGTTEASTSAILLPSSVEGSQTTIRTHEGSPLRGLGFNPGLAPASTIAQEASTMTNASSSSGSYNTAPSHGITPSSSDEARRAALQNDLIGVEDPLLMTPRMESLSLTESALLDAPAGGEPRPLSTKPSSIFSSSTSGQDDRDWDGYESPPPTDKINAMRRNERRYRIYLNHSFFPALRLPLWTPGTVKVGDVGYHSKPNGSFITLFNAFTGSPVNKPGDSKLPNILDYGNVTTEFIRQDARTAKERALEGLRSFIPNFGRAPTGSVERIAFPLRSGHKSAYLYAETTMYRYMSNLIIPKRWFKANADEILKIYGQDTAEHRLQKEDLMLVIGTLEAPDYALYVSHKSMDGRVHFSVFNNRSKGRPWGKFDVDRSSYGIGPEWEDEKVDDIHGENISTNGDSVKGWKSLILARLRFRPDEDDPTSQ